MFAEDRSQFFNDFAIPVLWKGTVTVNGIFDAGTGIVETGGVPIEMNRAVLTVDTDDMPGVTQGQAIVAEGTSYLIENIDHDGTGITTLEMSKV